MLTAQQIDGLINNSDFMKLYEQTEMDILEDMARRIKKTDFATSTTTWQMDKLKAMSANRAYVYDTLSKLTGKSEKQLFELFNEGAVESLGKDDKIYKAAGLDSVALSENKALQQVLLAGYNATKGTFTNLTNTTAIQATAQLGRVLDTAYSQVTSGAFTYDQAIKSAVNRLADAGIAAYRYPNGQTMSLYAATRRAVLTGVNQSAMQVAEARADEMGCDLVEVSAHIGARSDGSQSGTDHAWWQGKIYSRSGSHPKYPPLSDTGYGTVTGLAGANCRHGFYPFFEGISEPAYTDKELEEIDSKEVSYNGEKLTVDKALQVQRALERNVRKWKRREAVAVDDADKAKAKAKIKENQKKLVDFTKQTGLKRDYTRERMG